MSGLGAGRLAYALPGRDGERAVPSVAGGPPSARRALDLVLQELDGPSAPSHGLTELTVIAPSAAGKELAEVLRLRAVRANAEPPRLAPPAKRTSRAPRVGKT
jgi:hypothetical protein